MIQDGQRVRAAESNAAWASKQNDNELTGIQTLSNTDLASGASITNLQGSVNEAITDSATALTAAQNAETIAQALEDSKGQPNGIATLDVNGRTPVGQLAFETQVLLGTWDASTNTPTLDDTDTDITLADYYIVSAAGTVNFGAGNIEFEVGDWVLWDGSVWSKVPISSQPFNFNQDSDAVETGGDVEFQIPSNKNHIIFTDPGLVSIAGIFDEVAGYPFIITNGTGNPITILNEDATPTAEKRIVTGTGIDLVLENTASIFLVYNAVSSRWNVIGGSGSGSSGGGVGSDQFLIGESSDIEDGIGDWVAYADAAAATPVDGTGGSPTVTATQSASSPLVGTNSLLLTKDASNRQGEGIAVLSEDIDSAYLGRPLQVTMEVDATDANYAANDIVIYAYDVTNAALLGAIYNSDSGFILNEKYKFAGLIYPVSTTASIRLIAHIATTNASAYVIKFDEIKIYLAENIGIPVDLSQDINLTGSGNFTGGSIRVSKVGKSVTISGLSTVTHSSTNIPASAAGLIPEWAKPVGSTYNMFYNDSGTIAHVRIDADGTLAFRYTNYTGGSVSTTSFSPLSSISYTVPTSAGSVSALASNSNLEIFSTISSVKTPGASGQFQALTGNQVPLKAGKTYRITPRALFTQSGSASYSSMQVGLWASNGADSASSPALLSSLSSIQVLSQPNGSSNDTSRYFITGLSAATESSHVGPEFIIRVLQDVNLFVGTFATMGTAANARITAYATVQEIPFSNTALISGAIYLGTETWTDNQANATTSVEVFRNGKFVKVVGTTTYTGAQSGNFSLTIPSQYEAASSYNFTGRRFPVGTPAFIDLTSAQYEGGIRLDSSTNLIFSILGTNGIYTNISSTTPFTWASGDSITFEAEWIVNGW